ncbi:hypothetical protein B0A48_00508 [Cryoendolithus antarcticus]|uniref:Uncharacterized protein n=1 Tax=Cryoendolithus antarcticus TaxID=1507870 RepID=A0A1V8TUW5_9PEZI|nr:hypothetical protein B0A48_00508 [Cryoendolithus antarcticus]
MTLFNALIRTHHITSRKKITKLTQAAKLHDVFVLLRSGGPPGIMYVEGHETGVRGWVEVVANLRYKDYQLAARPGPVVREGITAYSLTPESALAEIETVKDFGVQMQRREVYEWWRAGMGYAGPPDRL